MAFYTDSTIHGSILRCNGFVALFTQPSVTPLEARQKAPGRDGA